MASTEEVGSGSNPSEAAKIDCDLQPWRDSGLLAALPTWCADSPDEDAVEKVRRLIEDNQWKLEDGGVRVSNADVASMGCEDLRNVLEVGSGCLLTPPSSKPAPWPVCEGGWYVYAPEFDPEFDSESDPEQWDRLACTDGKKWCESQPECSELGRCAPSAGPNGELRCTADANSCEHVPVCRKWGCVFDENEDRCTPNECAVLDQALDGESGIESVFDALDPDRTQTIAKLLEQSADLFERCEASPHDFDRLPPADLEGAPEQSEWPLDAVSVPASSPFTATLFRVRCLATKIPCAHGLDLSGGNERHSALAWSRGDSRGVIPLMGFSGGIMQGDVDFESATIRKLPSNAFGWTHELVWRERFSTEHWGSSKSGATCCGYSTDNRETLHAMLRVESENVSIGTLYVSKSAYDAYESYESGEELSFPAGVACEASLEWADDGSAVFTMTGNLARTVSVRPAPDGEGFKITTETPTGEFRRHKPTLEEPGCYSSRY